MTVLTATPNVIISPSAIIAIGTVVFIFGTLEAAIDYWHIHEWSERHRE
jgi:hypothetical protein